MTAYFSVSLVLIGILIGGAIWAINLNLRRFAGSARLIALLGPIVLLSMFFYSIHVLKGANCSWLIIFGLALFTAMVCILAGVLIVGILIIVAVGGYWTVVTVKHFNFRAFRRHFRRDFSYGWNRIKAWIEGEE